MQVQQVAGGSWSSCKVKYSSCTKYVFHAVGNTVCIRNAKIGEVLGHLEHHTAPVTSVAQPHANGLQLWTGSVDGIIAVWDYQDQVLLDSYDLGHPILWMDTSVDAHAAFAILDWSSTDQEQAGTSPS